MVPTLGVSLPRPFEAAEALSNLRFTPDGSGVAYRMRERGVDSIQIQPLDGSARRVFMKFSGAPIRVFRWSPDGSKLAVGRQRTDADVVLLRDQTKDR